MIDVERIRAERGIVIPEGWRPKWNDANYAMVAQLRRDGYSYGQIADIYRCGRDKIAEGIRRENTP